MKEIKIEIYKEENNYSCGFGHVSIGVVVCTNKTVEGLKHDFSESLRWHVEGCLEDGDNVPDWLKPGNYKIEYHENH